MELFVRGRAFLTENSSFEEFLEDSSRRTDIGRWRLYEFDMKNSFVFFGIDVLKEEKRRKIVPAVTVTALMRVIASRRPREFCGVVLP